MQQQTPIPQHAVSSCVLLHLVLFVCCKARLAYQAKLRSFLIPAECPRCPARQMAEAVAFMHEYGIIHRDIKGENFVFTEVGHLTEQATSDSPYGTLLK